MRNVGSETFFDQYSGSSLPILDKGEQFLRTI